MNTRFASGALSNLKDALHQLPIGRNTKRLLPLWPAIEEKLAAGVSQAEIVTLLNGNGFEMSLATFKTYLHRERKRQKKAPPTTSQPLGVVASATTPLISAPKAVAATRPPTFDYDPRGIPDLLK